MITTFSNNSSCWMNCFSSISSLRFLSKISDATTISMTTNPIEPPIKIIEFDAESDDSELCCSSWSGLLTSPSKSSVMPSELSWSCSPEQPNSLTESPLEVPAQISVLSPTPSLSASDHSVESIGKASPATQKPTTAILPSQ